MIAPRVAQLTVRPHNHPGSTPSEWGNFALIAPHASTTGETTHDSALSELPAPRRHARAGPRRRRPPRALLAFVSVAIAALLAAACGDSDDDGADAPSTDDPIETGSDAQVEIVGVSAGFEPSTLTVAAGTEVVWANVDRLGHTATAEDGSWDSGTLSGGDTFAFTADAPGTYRYFCSIHPSMTGELVVQ